MFSPGIFVAICMAFVSLVAALPARSKNTLGHLSAFSAPSSDPTNSSAHLRFDFALLDATAFNFALLEILYSHETLDTIPPHALTSRGLPPKLDREVDMLPFWHVAHPHDLKRENEIDYVDWDAVVLRPFVPVDALLSQAPGAYNLFSHHAEFAGSETPDGKILLRDTDTKDNGSWPRQVFTSHPSPFNHSHPVYHNFTENNGTVYGYGFSVFHPSHTGPCYHNHTHVNATLFEFFKHAQNTTHPVLNTTQLRHLILPSSLINTTHPHRFHEEMTTLLLHSNRTIIPNHAEIDTDILIWTHHTHISADGSTTHRVVPWAMIEKRISRTHLVGTWCFIIFTPITIFLFSMGVV